ncbi:MAG TPA: hypothetical protein VNI77_10900, partial [Nitrososphaera sp.]|nr:hypothetical protein [Nitrososphaera sp.]
MDSYSRTPGSKKFLYFPLDKESQEQQQRGQGSRELPRDILDKLLRALGREALREKTPSLQELEQVLQGAISSDMQKERQSQREPNSQMGKEGETGDESGMPLVRHLMNKGYLRDSPQWLSAKGFDTIGAKILSDVMKALKAGE